MKRRIRRGRTIVLNVQWQSAGPYPCFAAKRTARDNSRYHVQARITEANVGPISRPTCGERAAAYACADAYFLWSSAARAAPLSRVWIVNLGFLMLGSMVLFFSGVAVDCSAA